MFGPKRDEVKKGGCCLQDEMFHDVHCSEYSVGDVKMKIQLKCI